MKQEEKSYKNEKPLAVMAFTRQDIIIVAILCYFE